MPQTTARTFRQGLPGEIIPSNFSVGVPNVPDFRIRRAGITDPAPGLYPSEPAPTGLYPSAETSPTRPLPQPRIPANYRPLSSGTGLTIPPGLYPPSSAIEQGLRDRGKPSGGGRAADGSALDLGDPGQWEFDNNGKLVKYPDHPEVNPDVSLPLGAAVPGKIPGLFESVRTSPRLNDPAGVALPGSTLTAAGTVAQPAPAPSRYTLVQTTPSASSRPQSGLYTDADAIALSSLLNPAPVAAPGGRSSSSPGGGSAALAASDSFAELGAPGAILQGAAGLERTRLSLAAQDIMKREAGNIPQPTDSPEIRAGKLNYLTKRIGSAAAAAGVPATTQELAATAAEISKLAGQPRLINLGKDSSGNAVEGTLDANRNFSRIAPRDTTSNGTQLAKLINERDAYHAAGRTDIVAQYDEAIANYGAKYDAFGNPITRPTGEKPAANGSLAAKPAGTAAAPASAPPDMNAQALAWANANPKDPRSAQIKARLNASPK